jgi:tetratricopeptide (TPR) repeat protein
MIAKQIIEFIKKPQTISSANISSIESVLFKHPYCQSGQLLLTKGLLNTNSIRYNKQLKKAAAHCLDRKKLFKLITFKKISKTEDEKFNTKEQKSAEKELNLGRPLEFDTTEHHSFSEWLTVLNVKKIERKGEKKGASLIDEFLEKEIKIRQPKKETFFKAIDISKGSVMENDELVTPTLAKVYLEQEHYKKAIEAYKKLILRNPKKSSFFADQIKLINKLNNK